MHITVKGEGRFFVTFADKHDTILEGIRGAFSGSTNLLTLGKDDVARLLSWRSVFLEEKYFITDDLRLLARAARTAIAKLKIDIQRSRFVYPDRVLILVRDDFGELEDTHYLMQAAPPSV